MEAKDYITHGCSNSIKKWSNFCLIAGSILVVVAIIAWLMDGPGGKLMAAGLIAILLQPILNGFSIIVRRAERELAKDDDLQ